MVNSQPTSLRTLMLAISSRSPAGSARCAGSGKSGGVRVVYFNRGRFDEVFLMLIYAKANLDSISGETLKELRDAAEKANG